MFGSHTNPFHPGRAAQSGLMTAVLASNGYTSSLQGFEAKWGSRASAPCGRSQKMPTSRFHVTLWFILSLIAAFNFTKNSRQRRKVISSFRSVCLRVHPLALEVTGKKTLQNDLQAKFSIFHGVAVRLLLGKAEPAQYEDEVVLSDEVEARSMRRQTASQRTRHTSPW